MSPLVRGIERKGEKEMERGTERVDMSNDLFRFYDPTEGRILLDGTPLTEIDLLSLHQHCAWVAQDTQVGVRSLSLV